MSKKEGDAKSQEQQEGSVIDLDFSCPKCSSTHVIATVSFAIDTDTLKDTEEGDVFEGVFSKETLAGVSINCKDCHVITRKEL